MCIESVPDIVDEIALILLGTGVPILIGLLIKSIKDLREIKGSHVLRRDENRLLFKGVLELIVATRTGQHNGNLSTIENEIQVYLQKTAIR